MALRPHKGRPTTSNANRSWPEGVQIGPTHYPRDASSTTPLLRHRASLGDAVHGVVVPLPFLKTATNTVDPNRSKIGTKLGTITPQLENIDSNVDPRSAPVVPGLSLKLAPGMTSTGICSGDPQIRFRPIFGRPDGPICPGRGRFGGRLR
jgi:hypothetical protein